MVVFINKYQITLTTAKVFCALLVLVSITIAGCNDDNDDVLPDNNDEPIFFSGVSRSDFIDVEGNKTPHSALLARCSILKKNDNSCSLNELSFIAKTTGKPNKAEILDRLIVSDLWMADNFSMLLNKMPEDIYRLFSSTTAIIIHKNIRPAFFWAVTGAIYLDPAFLWLTSEQLDSISQEPDFRQAFAQQFEFTTLSLYSSKGEPAFGSNRQRTETQTLHALSALLFHELAHANDFFPMQTIVEADPNETPINIIQSQRLTSDLLNRLYPLRDETLHRLASALFAGQVADPSLLSLSANDVASLFDVDHANDTYAYFISPGANPDWHFEDTALLFEEVMMKIHFDLNRELAFATPLVDDVRFLDDLKINKNFINRFQDEQLLPRTQTVVDNLLPNNTHLDFFNELPNANEPAYLGNELSIKARSKERILIPYQHRHQ